MRPRVAQATPMPRVTTAEQPMQESCAGTLCFPYEADSR
jgi:hypothetical protein